MASVFLIKSLLVASMSQKRVNNVYFSQKSSVVSFNIVQETINKRTYISQIHNVSTN